MTTKAVKCPICKNPSHEAFAPFCTKRCADVDLGRWLKGGYAIPGRDGEATIPANDTDNDIEFD